MLTTKPLSIFSLQNGTHFSNHLIRRHGIASDENIVKENNTKNQTASASQIPGGPRLPLSVITYTYTYFHFKISFKIIHTHTHTHTQKPIRMAHSIRSWLQGSACDSVKWYPLFNKNQAARNLRSPELEARWRTVAIIIRVVLLSPYLCIRGVSLSSIHYNQSRCIYINQRHQYIRLIWN